MKTMVLLGAGSSVEAGVPATVDMTRAILERFGEDWSLRASHRILTFVVGGLLFQRGIRGQDPYEGVDVEELFAAVQLLSRRNTLEAAPFVGSWHAMVEELDRRQNYSSRQPFKKLVEGLYTSIVDELAKHAPRRVATKGSTSKQLSAFIGGKSRTAPDIDKAIGNAIVGMISDWLVKAKRGRPSMPSFFDRDFTRAVESQQSLPGDGGPFESTAEDMISMLTKLVWLDSPERVEHLEPLAKLAHNRGGLTVATLNYDNAMELLAESYSQAVHRGLEEWSRSGNFLFPKSGIALLKMHGSIDWVLEPAAPVPDAPLPRHTVRIASPEELEKSGFRPAVVFGQGSKLTAEGPFLDLLRSFREALSGHGNLLIVGYSFRDDHVNEYLAQWINADSERTLTIVDPGFQENHTAFAEDMRRLDESRLRIIPERASVGLAMAFSEDPPT